jgi:hypothetical protein
MIFHLIIIAILLFLFIYISYVSVEKFNTSYKQSNYSPNTNEPIPIALDKVTKYLSPDLNGDCPSFYQRDKNDENSLCHSQCYEDAKFYNVDGYIHGCVVLNTQFPPKKDGGSSIAKDKKTRIISPESNGSCPKDFTLDVSSGLCYYPCADSTKTFYGELGCLILNKEYPQTKYGTSSIPFPLADDGKTQYVSPTPDAKCPENFKIDIPSGLCHIDCSFGMFNGDKYGSTIVGCK